MALVLCGAGSREVFGHLRLAGPTDYTHFRDGSCWLLRGVAGTELSHGRRRREAETAVGDQETNIGKAVMLSVLEMWRRSVVEQTATAPSRGNRRIAGRRSGCFDAEVLGDSVTTGTHARAFSATTDEGVSGGVREMLR